ncbi:hypothetical protein, partial [Leyella stercorea]|uniref:hypothetical protein n=1 Tax=Leyella stercorea TaxID=363265 RepID=UPI0026DC5075
LCGVVFVYQTKNCWLLYGFYHLIFFGHFETTAPPGKQLPPPERQLHPLRDNCTPRNHPQINN